MMVNQWSLHSPLFEENNENVSNELEFWSVLENFNVAIANQAECTGSVNHLKKSKLNLLNNNGVIYLLYWNLEIYGLLQCFEQCLECSFVTS